MLSALYCVTMFKYSRESKYTHIFGQTLKLQSAVVTVNIRSRSLKSNSLFSVSKQITCIYASLMQKKNLWFRRQSSERLNLMF